MTRWPGLTEDRRMEWEAERRFLVREKQRIERRVEEIDDILSTFWPEKAA